MTTFTITVQQDVQEAALQMPDYAALTRLAWLCRMGYRAGNRSK